MPSLREGDPCVGGSALAAAFVVAALVVWVIAGDWDDPNNQKNARRRAAAPAPTDGTEFLGQPGTSPDIEVVRWDRVRRGFNAAANNVVDPSTKTGGTLRLLAGSDCDSWDPGRTSYGWCWNLQRLITRTLVGYTSGERHAVQARARTSRPRSASTTPTTADGPTRSSPD